MKISNKQFNTTVSSKMVNYFAYKYIHRAVLDTIKTYNLPSSLEFMNQYASETCLQLTTYNTKKSTDLTFVVNADYYNNVVILKIVNSYNDSASFVEINFDEIQSVIESNSLITYINSYVESALRVANKVVDEYKKEHNIK